MGRYSEFAYAGLPSALLDAAAMTLPLPLLASRFGAEAAGQFALAQRILQAPAVLVGKSVAEAFHARIARHVRERPEQVARFFRRTSAILTLIGLVPAVALVVVASAGLIFYGFLMIGRIPVQLVVILVVLTGVTVWSLLTSLFKRARTPCATA